MKTVDSIRWIWCALLAQRLRSLLTLLGMAIGISAVTLMSALGEGVRQHVLQEFTQFGSHLLAITPGKTETFGIGGMLNTLRPLSLADARSLSRLQSVEKVVPVVFGTAAIKHAGRSRHSNVAGVGPDAQSVWQLRLAQGRFLPQDDLENARPFAVLGSTLKRELFGDAQALGESVHIGSSRFRVIGVLAPKGQFLGTDLDDSAYIPVSRGLKLFNRESLMEIDLAYHPGISTRLISDRVRQRLIARHGLEDFTLITQDEVLKSLDQILRMLKYAGGSLGLISLVVGGVGILSIMLITTTERAPEIGLLRALGCSTAQIRNLFLGEAILLALAGCLLGLAITAALLLLSRWLLPGLPLTAPVQMLLLALAVSALIGLLAGVKPATDAAAMNPIVALRQEE
ncbi:MAG: putative ABC transport system permease protein [Motiliproteus sp.]